MNGQMTRLGVLMGASLLTAFGGSAAQAQSCSRTCLEDVLNRYLAAVIRHDPASAPLGAGYRETDNAIATVAGKGLWKTLTGLGKVQRHYMDPVTGGVGFFGTALEGEDGVIVTLRLLVEDRKVIEAEWIVGRKDTGTPMSNGLGQTSIEGVENTPPPPVTILPKEKRLPRRVLIAAVNGYFDSVQTGDNDLFPSKPNYVRLENGMGTGEGPGGAARGGKGIFPGRAAAMKAGTMQGGATAAGAAANPDICGGICNVAGRRYPIVDEEQGVVLGLVVFQRPPANANRRNLLSEWFYFDKDKVAGIWASMHYINPTFAAPNWPPYDGNFPLSYNVGISPMPNPAPPPGGMAPGGPGMPPPPAMAPKAN